MTDLLIEDFCDTRLLRLRNDLGIGPRLSFEESGNSEDRAESMFGESAGLKALGVSGNVWVLGVCSREASCAAGPVEISLDTRCSDRRVLLRPAMTMLSSRSGLRGRLGEPDRLGKPLLVNADEGKEGSRDMW